MTIATEGIETFTIDSDHVSLDLIVWRRYHRPIEGLVELALTLNPGIAELGEYIPIGTVIKVPRVAPRAGPAASRPIRLWE